MKKHFFFAQKTPEQIAEFLKGTNLYFNLTDEDFKYLLTLFPVCPDVAQAFFMHTLLPLAKMMAKQFNEAYPMIHFTTTEVATMAYVSFVNTDFASLLAWNEECCCQRWLNLVYPQRCKDTLRKMGITPKTSRTSQKALRLNLLSRSEDECLFIIDHLDDPIMARLLTAIYVERKTPEEIEALTGMDDEEQDKFHKAAANCLRLKVEEHRGIIFYERNGVLVNAAAGLFPSEGKHDELSLSEMVRIDDANFDIADDDGGDDELTEFLRERYPYLNIRAACNQLVDEATAEAKLTVKEAFVWQGRMDGLSSAEIAARYNALMGKNISASNVDNAVQVAKKKIIKVIKAYREQYLMQK